MPKKIKQTKHDKILIKVGKASSEFIERKMLERNHKPCLGLMKVCNCGLVPKKHIHWKKNNIIRFEKPPRFIRYSLIKKNAKD